MNIGRLPFAGCGQRIVDYLMPSLLWLPKPIGFWLLSQYLRRLTDEMR